MNDPRLCFFFYLGAKLLLILQPCQIRKTDSCVCFMTTDKLLEENEAQLQHRLVLITFGSD